MSLTSGKLLGISITLDSKKKILEEIEKYLVPTKRPNVRPLVIVTPNPEQIVLAHGDKHFAKILNGADVAIPDGIGIVWAAEILGISKNFQRIPGIELFERLAAVAAKRSVRIGLIGGTGDLAVKAFECLEKQHPSLKGEAKAAPKFSIIQNQLKTENPDEYFAEVGEWINKKKIQMLFVGLGAPKQEYFIEHLKSKILSPKSSSCILMSVGGSFDILAGRIRRAPLVVRLIGFEWMWRLLIEPWRFRRQLALVKFVKLVLFVKFRSTSK